MIQDCGLNDDALSVLGKRVSKIRLFCINECIVSIGLKGLVLSSVVSSINGVSSVKREEGEYHCRQSQ